MQFCVEEGLTCLADVREILEQRKLEREEAVKAAQREVKDRIDKLQGRA